MSGPDSELPLWLLDIDGVINALSRVGLPETWAASEWVERVVYTEIPQRGLMTLPILAARPVLDFVAEVHASGRAEVRWHSTWRAAAVTAFAPMLGLPRTIPISVAPEWSAPSSERWWKQPAAERAHAVGRRLLWTDDDLEVYRHEVAALSDERTLLISPNPITGLTPDDLDSIAGFLRRR